MTVYTQDPNSKLDYIVNWSTFLSGGETISASTWNASSTGVTLSGLANSTNTATVWLTGGVVGEVVILDNKITTSATRIADRRVVVRIEDR